MELEIKKDLTSNWFKTLQNSICHCIQEFENNTIKFSDQQVVKEMIKEIQ